MEGNFNRLKSSLFDVLCDIDVGNPKMSITINRCAKCGHEWPQSGKTPPRRCPASGCRTMKWRVDLRDITNDELAAVMGKPKPEDLAIFKDVKSRMVNNPYRLSAKDKKLVAKESAKAIAEYGNTATAESIVYDYKKYKARGRRK